MLASIHALRCMMRSCLLDKEMHRSPAMCCVSGTGAVPGNLLRFDATIKLSSTGNRTLFAQDAVKGIVMGEAANRTSYQPIDIAQLPYSAKPPVCARSTTAHLGRAAWAPNLRPNVCYF